MKIVKSKQTSNVHRDRQTRYVKLKKNNKTSKQEKGENCFHFCFMF